MMLKYPWLMLLFLLYLPIIYFYITRLKRGDAYIGVSTVQAFARYKRPWKKSNCLLPSSGSSDPAWSSRFLVQNTGNIPHGASAQVLPG